MKEIVVNNMSIIKQISNIAKDITEDMFTDLIDTEEDVEYEEVNFNRVISEHEIINELSKDGWRPATVYELIRYIPEWKPNILRKYPRVYTIGSIVYDKNTKTRRMWFIDSIVGVKGLALLCCVSDTALQLDSVLKVRKKK